MIEAVLPGSLVSDLAKLIPALYQDCDILLLVMLSFPRMEMDNDYDGRECKLKLLVLSHPLAVALATEHTFS